MYFLAASKQKEGRFMQITKSMFSKMLAVFIMAVLLTAMTIPALAGDRKTPSLNKRSITLTVGKSYKLSVSGTNRKVKWISSKSRVATVAGNGTVKAKKKGKAIVTAKAGRKKMKCTVNVKPAKKTAPKSISLNISTLVMDKGASFKLKASVFPAGAKTKLTWKSSNSKIASVSGNGKVKAKKAGKVKITVTTKGKKKASVSVTVNNKKGKHVVWSTPAWRTQHATQPSVQQPRPTQSAPGNNQEQKTLQRSLKGIRLICVLKELPYNYTLNMNNFMVTAVYSDGSEKAYSDVSISMSKNTQNKTFEFTAVSNENAAVTDSVSVSYKEPDAKKPVSLRVEKHVQYYEKNAQPAAKDFSVFQKYADGSEEPCKTFSVKAKSDGNQWTITFTSGNLATSVHIPVKNNQPQEKTIDYITVSAKMDSASYEYMFKTSDVVVTEVYKDGSSAAATTFTLAVKSDAKQHTLTVTDKGFTATCTVKVSGNSGSQETEAEQYKLSVSMNPDKVNVGASLMAGQMTVKATNIKTGEVQEVKDYTTTFKPQSKAGEYAFTVSWNKTTCQVKVAIVDPSNEIKSASIDYKGIHGNYVVIEEGVKASDFVVTAAYADGSSRTLTAGKWTLGAVKLASTDGGMTTAEISVPGLKTSTMSIPSYHSGSLKENISVSRKGLQEDGAWHLKTGEVFNKANIVFTATTYGGQNINVPFDVDFISSNTAGTYTVHIIYQGKTYATGSVVVE